VSDEEFSEFARIQSKVLVTQGRVKHFKDHPKETRLKMSQGECVGVAFGCHSAAAHGLLSGDMKDEVRDLFKVLSELRAQQKAFENEGVQVDLEGELTRALEDPEGSPMADERMAKLVQIRLLALVRPLRVLYLKAHPEETRLKVDEGDRMCVGFGDHKATASGLLSEDMKDEVRDLFKVFSELRAQQKALEKVRLQADLEGELTRALEDPEGSPMADERMAKLVQIRLLALVRPLRVLYLKAHPEETRLKVDEGDRMSVAFGNHGATANGLLSEDMKDEVRDLFKVFSELRGSQISKRK
jgi:hypothetical protein